jgi:hypothetical protein
MNMANVYPSLYQVNIRVYLTDLGRSLGRRATLDDVPDATIAEWAELGFDWIWLLSVWQTGPIAQSISRSYRPWLDEFKKTIPDLTMADIEGSGFAIQAYSVHKDLGGNAALSRLRSRMQSYNLKLMLDFVPNHMAPDHAWVLQRPDYFVQGMQEDLDREPGNFRMLPTPTGNRIFAMGRDPHFPGWADTLQLNYGNPALQSAMLQELSRVSEVCDGVRCDMAMLVTPEVFKRTWKIDMEPFWPNAIRSIRSRTNTFVFVGEVYWDMEWSMIQQGFDYCYDKHLYDRLVHESAQSVRAHLQADIAYQRRLTRFLENHDEPRAASVLSREKHAAAAVLCYLVPGLRFFHQGQLEGKLVKISPHLVRGPNEQIDVEISQLYERLLRILGLPVFKTGLWRIVDAREAWSGNATHNDIIAFEWQSASRDRWIVTVNYSDHSSQAKLQLPPMTNARRAVRLKDRWNDVEYERELRELEHGLYVDLSAWGVHVFELEA